jgi:hypothetical protein
MIGKPFIIIYPENHNPSEASREASSGSETEGKIDPGNCPAVDRLEIIYDQ